MFRSIELGVVIRIWIIIGERAGLVWSVLRLSRLPVVRILRGILMHESDAICAITDFLDAMCVEKDQHLRETPRRFVSAFKEYLSGYNQSFETLGIVTQFDNGGYDEIILEKSIPFYSICAH